MNNKLIFFIGILGAILFVSAAISGGFLTENYNPISQYISETYATGTPYGKLLRFWGFIPSGILLTIFFVAAIKKFPKNKFIKIGFVGLAIFYGIASIIVGIFPCDKGCPDGLENVSASQIIHNLTGLLTYLIVPASILLIGKGLKAALVDIKTTKYTSILGWLSLVFVIILLSNPKSNYIGLYQRIIETIFIIWIIICSFYIKRIK